MFLNLPGLAIVVGGTLAATFISYPLGEVLRVFRLFGTALRNEKLYTQHDIDELVQISRLWMRGDLQAVEKELDRVDNPFLHAGVQMVVDMTPEEDILDFMQWRIARLKAREHAEAQLFRVMSGFAPAFGMIPDDSATDPGPSGLMDGSQAVVSLREELDAGFFGDDIEVSEQPGPRSKCCTLFHPEGVAS